MKSMLLCFLFLVCLAPLGSRAKAIDAQHTCIFFQDPVKEKKKKAKPERCKPSKPLARNKSKSAGKKSRKRGNMGNSGGRGNMYFARNNP